MAADGLGSVNDLLDLTPYQLLRLRGWSPNAKPTQRAGGTARLIELRGMLA